MIDASLRRPDETSPHPTGPVLVLMDDSYEAAEALTWARRFTEGRRGPIAVRPWNPGLGEFGPKRRRAGREQVHASLLRACARLDDGGRTIAADACVVLEGEMPTALERYAVAVGSPLVVVGIDPPAAAKSGEAESFHRALAHQVVGTAVAFVPAGGAARPLRRIVVGVDGSVSSLGAVAWTARLARRLGAEVSVVAVLEPMLEWVPANDPSSPWQRTRSLLEGPWSEPLRRAGVDVVADVVEGVGPVDALARYGLDRHVDAFVVGASERAGRLHTRRGTVATHLAHAAGLAVVMAPTPPTT